jgi:hypothetical protein
MDARNAEPEGWSENSRRPAIRKCYAPGTRKRQRSYGVPSMTPLANLTDLA